MNTKGKECQWLDQKKPRQQPLLTSNYSHLILSGGKKVLKILWLSI